MKLIHEYRTPELLQRLAARLQQVAVRPLTVMEFCGSHTVAIARYGIRSILPPQFRLISGPGCPVCVTSRNYIDEAIRLAGREKVILTTFGDMLRVPGTERTLQQARAAGGDVRIVYSPLEAVQLARQQPQKEIVFLGVGFETTAPVVGLSILEAARLGLCNYSVFSAHKRIVPALRLMAVDTGLHLQGILGPGHVGVVTGTHSFRFLAADYGIPVAIAGFEAADILQALISLTECIQQGRAKVINHYHRVVKPEGNREAQAVLAKVFYSADSWWRGLGTIPQSGLAIRPEYASHDAEKKFQLAAGGAEDPEGCSCGAIITGKKTPPECLLFGTGCTPKRPAGACMVSAEGACAAYYRYHVIQEEV